MKRMNKKGNLVFNTLMWIFKIFFVVIVLFTLVFLIRSFISTELDIFNAEADIFIQRLFMSRNGISFYDENIGRLYPGVIDKNSFLLSNIEDRLNYSIYYGIENKRIAANITLMDSQGTIRSVIYNPDYYDRWKMLVKALWIRGPGGVRPKTKEFNVLIREEGSFKPGILKIEVIIPNS